MIPVLTIRAQRLCGAVFIVALLLALVPLLQPVMQNGDAAVYNEQIEARALGIRTTHVGYIALGIAFRSLLPGDTDLVMNVMTLFLGALGVLAIYFAAYRLTASVVASVFAAISVLAVPAYLRGMLLSEVDVPLAAMVAVSFALWLSARPRLAGLCFGLAMLISPLASLALPSFLVTGAFASSGDHSHDAERSRWLALRPIALFALASLGLYLPVVLIHYQDYLYGGRGLMEAPRDRIDFANQLQRSYTFFTSQVLVLLPLYALGALIAIRRKQRALVIGIALAALVSMLAGERFSDVPVQLTTVTLASLLIAFASTDRRRVARVAIALLTLIAIAWNGWSALQSARGEIAARIRERETYREMARVSPLPIILVNVRGFLGGQRAERLITGKTKGGRTLALNALKKRCDQLAADPTLYALWFVRKPYSACGALLARYAWSSITIQGDSYRVLLPRK